jgi:hypothetical protein
VSQKASLVIIASLTPGRKSFTIPVMASRMTRYRFDFLVPEIHEISEDHAGIEEPVTPPPRNPTLDRLRAALAEDPHWERSMLAPWRPFGQYQHLIVWLDITRPESEGNSELPSNRVRGPSSRFGHGARGS